MSIVAKINRAEWDELRARYPDCTEHDITHASLYSDPDFRRIFLDKVAENRRRRAALPCVSPEAEVIETVPPPAPLTPRRATGATDAEALRVIRNSCAEYMTGNPREIAAEEQARWWASDARRGMAIWLFDAPSGPVGFGLIRMVGGRWWATLGLLPEWRGMGHGTAIYRHLREHCPADLHIDVLLTNVRSARAAERAGFRLEDWNGSVATLVARRG